MGKEEKKYLGTFYYDPDSPEAIKRRIQKPLKEVELMQKGLLPKRSVWDLLDEEEENDENPQ